MDTYKVIIPNLARREDRFHVCMGTLLSQGVPPAHIKRFFAHDGGHYFDSEHISHYATTDSIIQHRYGTGAFIRECYDGWDVYNYAWNWTWYDILDAIAREADELPPTLVLIDDWAMKIDYDAIVKHVRGLYLAEQPFCLLQYAHSTSEGPEYPTNRNNRRTAVPNIQHGVAGTAEAALLFSPQGARRIIEFADTHPEHAPEILMWHFSRDGDNAGCYSVIENEAHHIGYAGYSVFQDRCTLTGGKSLKYEPEDN